MKRITLKLDEWGPNYLMAPRTGKKCCLGFASLQAGLTEGQLRNTRLPCDLEYSGYRLTKDFEQFVAQLQKNVSPELAARANQLITGKLYTFNSRDDSYQTILSSVNDWYHKCRIKNKEKLLEPTLEVLKMGFAEMGYQLVISRKD